MRLLKRIAVGSGDQERKDAATAIIAQREHNIINGWNEELENEIWQKIVSALKARKYSELKNKPFDQR